MRFEICKKCGTQKGKKYGENGCSTMLCRNCQDEIQENTNSMEEKLEELDIPLSECCGAWYTDMRFCSACHEHC